MPEDRVVFKLGCSGFDNTDLEQVLRELEIEGVITCGIWSEYCVTETSLSALKLGFDVCLVEDAHGTVASTESEATETTAKQNAFVLQNKAKVISVKFLDKIFS